MACQCTNPDCPNIFGFIADTGAGLSAHFRHNQACRNCCNAAGQETALDLTLQDDVGSATSPKSPLSTEFSYGPTNSSPLSINSNMSPHHDHPTSPVAPHSCSSSLYARRSRSSISPSFVGCTNDDDNDSSVDSLSDHNDPSFDFGISVVPFDVDSDDDSDDDEDNLRTSSAEAPSSFANANLSILPPLPNCEFEEGSGDDEESLADEIPSYEHHVENQFPSAGISDPSNNTDQQLSSSVPPLKIALQNADQRLYEKHKQYLHSKIDNGSDPGENASILLQQLLKDCGAPLLTHDKILDWAKFASSNGVFDNRQCKLLSRKDTLDLSDNISNLKGLHPKMDRLKLPNANVSIDVVTHDIKEAIYSLLTDKDIFNDENLDIPSPTDPPLSFDNPKSIPDDYLLY